MPISIDQSEYETTGLSPWNQIIENAILRTDRLLFGEKAQRVKGRPRNCFGATIGLYAALDKSPGLCFDGGHFWTTLRADDDIWFADAYWGLMQCRDEPQTHIPLANRENVYYDLAFTLAAHDALADVPEGAAYRMFAKGTFQEMKVTEAVVLARSTELLESLDELYISPTAVPGFVNAYIQSRSPKKIT